MFKAFRVIPTQHAHVLWPPRCTIYSSNSLKIIKLDKEAKADVDAARTDSGLWKEALQGFALSTVRSGGRLHGHEEVRWHFLKPQRSLTGTLTALDSGSGIFYLQVSDAHTPSSPSSTFFVILQPPFPAFRSLCQWPVFLPRERNFLGRLSKSSLIQ